MKIGTSERGTEFQALTVPLVHRMRPRGWHDTLRSLVAGLLTVGLTVGTLPTAAASDLTTPASWQPVLAAYSISDVRVDPTNSSRIYAAGARVIESNPPSVRTFGAASVFISNDGGSTWSSADLGGGLTSVTSLAIDPNQSRLLYTALYQSGATPILTSRDGGVTWTAPSVRGSESLSLTLWDVVADPRNSGHVYGGAALDGLFRSTDAGQTWQKITVVNDPCDARSIAIGRTGVLYVGGCGLFKSSDGGHTWQRLVEFPATVRDLALDPADPNRIFVAATPPIQRRDVGGVWRSTDGGATWTQLANTGEFAHLVHVDPRDSRIIYAITWFGFEQKQRTPGKHVLWSRDGGETWDELGGKLPTDDAFTLRAVGNQLFLGGLGGLWRLDLPLPAPRDERYFLQTGFRIDNDTIWDYFTHRGGVNTFGYPISRTFRFQGFTVQFFQRRIIQLDHEGTARILNVLDPGLLPYNRFNLATFPAYDAELVATAPDPRDQAATLAFAQAHVVDTFQGRSVNFLRTFQRTVAAETAFPNGGNLDLLPGINLEMWGIPTSRPMVDPNNHDFVYQRFQRGIMMYRASCNCAEGVLLADYLKSVLTGQNLPPDLEEAARTSPLYRQYDPSKLNWVRDPNLLPYTDLTNAFEPQ